MSCGAILAANDPIVSSPEQMVERYALQRFGLRIRIDYKTSDRNKHCHTPDRHSDERRERFQAYRTSGREDLLPNDVTASKVGSYFASDELLQIARYEFLTRFHKEMASFAEKCERLGKNKTFSASFPSLRVFGSGVDVRSGDPQWHEGIQHVRFRYRYADGVFHEITGFPDIDAHIKDRKSLVGVVHPIFLGER